MHEILDEASMHRFYQHLLKDGDCIAVVSAERGTRSTAENNAKTKELRKIVSAHQHFRGSNKNYGFHKAKGGYAEVDHKTGELLYNGEEHSTCIYAHCDTDEEELNFREFIVFLGQKFEQENVLYVGRDKQVVWIYTCGPKKGTIEHKGKWHPHAIEEWNEEKQRMEIFYTKIKGRKSGFENPKTPQDIEVKVAPMQIKSIAVTKGDISEYKPSEIANIWRMFQALDEAIAKGDGDYEEVFKYCYTFESSSKEVLKESILEILKGD